MAKRKTAKTVEDLIAAVSLPGESVTAWCTRVNYPVRTLSRMLSGLSEPRLGSLTLLANRLQLDPAKDLDTLRAAIAESRRAAAKD